MFYFFLLFLLLGRTMVFYSLSPYYSALGLVLSAMFGCVVLGFCGLSFLALLLLLIYMGGMLVVFIYSRALSADRFPRVRKIGEVFVLFSLISFWVLFIFEGFVELKFSFSEMARQQDLSVLSGLYSFGGIYLLVCGLALLVVLVVALVISYSFSEISLRAL